MRILVLILLAIYFGISRTVASSETGFIKVKEDDGSGGIWKTNVEWKYYWVKDWRIRQVYVPYWKKVWAPVEIKQWVPTTHHHGWKQH